MQRTHRQEASLINDAVLAKIGAPTARGAQWVDGRSAIREMQDANFTSWREVEWPGYYIKYIVQDAINSGFLGEFESIVDRKHYMAKGSHLWDIRTTSIENDVVLLTDCARWDDLIAEHGGIGLIVFMVEYEKDRDGSFWQWHTELGGGESEYVQDRIARGAPPRRRKTEFTIFHSFAFYFDEALMQRALDEGWMTEVAGNMRNQDGSQRNPKYAFHLGEAPTDILIGVRPFNWEPSEADEAFDGFPIM